MIHTQDVWAQPRKARAPSFTVCGSNSKFHISLLLSLNSYLHLSRLSNRWGKKTWKAQGGLNEWQASLLYIDSGQGSFFKVSTLMSLLCSFVCGNFLHTSCRLVFLFLKYAWIAHPDMLIKKCRNGAAEIIISCVASATDFHCLTSHTLLSFPLFTRHLFFSLFSALSGWGSSGLLML